MIFTTKLNHFQNQKNYIICECGSHIKQIARLMVEEGIKNYDGLWDLPGTVAAAVYGNAGCYGCEMSRIFDSADILTPQGNIRTLYLNDLSFSKRDSSLKRGVIKGVILSVKLKKERGDVELIKKQAVIAHWQRMNMQPGPQNNLGSCFMSGTKRMWYRVYQRFVSFLNRYLHLNLCPLELELRLLGYSKLIPYLYDMNRFMWKDVQSVEAFDDYVRLYHKLYKKAKLEINIFE